jgi:alkylated DNA repair dioxygenase AlkB
MSSPTGRGQRGSFVRKVAWPAAVGHTRTVVKGQLTLLGAETPAFDAEFRALRRMTLADGAWVDILPGWLVGHTEVFDALARTTSWRHERREMYDRVLDVPRLYGVLPDDGHGHPVIEPIRRALSCRYATSFERVSVALYRDGRDSVAWHGDHVARRMPTALVASVSVGAPRRLLLRPKGGGKSISMTLGWGDLLVMGGSCQRTWQHCVPKVQSAPPRIVIMFRPVWRADSSTLVADSD